MNNTENTIDVAEKGLGEGESVQEAELTESVKQQIRRWQVRQGIHYGWYVAVGTLLLGMLVWIKLGIVRTYGLKLIGIICACVLGTYVISVMSVVAIMQRAMELCRVLEDTFIIVGYDEELAGSMTYKYGHINKSRYFAIVHERCQGEIHEYRIPCSKQFYENQDYNKPLLFMKNGVPYFVADMAK